MKIAFQMDPIGPIDIRADSTFRLMLEAQARGHELFYYTPDALAYEEGRITARGWPVEVQSVVGDHYRPGAAQSVDLAGFDVVWLRQDPPFDMHYITTTHLLERLGPGTLVVNDPFWVRNFPEKLLILNFPDLMPPTAIARDIATIRAFRARPVHEPLFRFRVVRSPHPGPFGWPFVDPLPTEWPYPQKHRTSSWKFSSPVQKPPLCCIACCVPAE